MFAWQNFTNNSTFLKVYLDSPTKTGEFLKRGAVLPNATNKHKKGEIIGTKRSAQKYLNAKHFMYNLNGAKNTHYKTKHV